MILQPRNYVILILQVIPERCIGAPGPHGIRERKKGLPLAADEPALAIVGYFIDAECHLGHIDGGD